MNPFMSTELFIKDIASAELAKFRLQRDWQSKYRIIMQLGKQLPMLPAELKTEESLVQGCESAAWLQVQVSPLAFAFDSEARVVKGIIALVLAVWFEHEQKSALTDCWLQLNLGAELSTSRNNGVAAVLRLMQQAMDTTAIH